MIGRFSHIFFDFDGVLAESVSVKTEAFYEMYLPYGQDIALKVRQHHIENGGVSRFEKFKIYNGIWLGEDLSEVRVQALSEEYSSRVLTKVVQSPEVFGAMAFLEKYSSVVNCWIITGTPTVEIREILTVRKMNHHFKGAYGSPEKKSFWVRTLMLENNISPYQAVFIGDAVADFHAAEENKIAFVLRETADNILLFTTFNGPRIKDLTDLGACLETF